jgi:hypothetical protein
MNVNVDTRDFNGLNHWVGVHIRRENGNTTVNYVDPTGHPPSEAVLAELKPLGPITNQGIQLQQGSIIGSGQDAYWEGNNDDCGPLMIYMLQQLARGQEGVQQLQAEQETIFNATTPLTKSRELGQRLRHEQQQQLQNFHLKRAGKEAGEIYGIRESVAAINGNSSELLNKINKEAVIAADIDLKAVDVKEQVASDKVGKVEFLAEQDHIKDHAQNTKSLIDRIKSSSIDQNTVIAIERKSYGQNLGVPDVIMLANIIEHNEKNPNNQLKVPEEITKDSLIYQDAVLYNTAKEHGVKVIGLEGKNLEAGKDSAEEYNKAREDYMASRITKLTEKGYNVIAYVGSAHVKNLKRSVESKLENKPSVENKLAANQVSEELQQMAAIIGEGAKVHLSQSTTIEPSIPVLPNEKQLNKQNSGIGR